MRLLCFFTVGINILRFSGAILFCSAALDAVRRSGALISHCCFHLFPCFVSEETRPAGNAWAAIQLLLISLSWCSFDVRPGSWLPAEPDPVTANKTKPDSVFFSPSRHPTAGSSPLVSLKPLYLDRNSVNSVIPWPIWSCIV